jgi:hypothetical protein
VHVLDAKLREGPLTAEVAGEEHLQEGEHGLRVLREAVLLLWDLGYNRLANCLCHYLLECGLTWLGEGSDCLVCNGELFGGHGL